MGDRGAAFVASVARGELTVSAVTARGGGVTAAGGGCSVLRLVMLSNFSIHSRVATLKRFTIVVLYTVNVAFSYFRCRFSMFDLIFRFSNFRFHF